MIDLITKTLNQGTNGQVAYTGWNCWAKAGLMSCLDRAQLQKSVAYHWE